MVKNMNSFLKKSKNTIRKKYFRNTFRYGKELMESDSANNKIKQLLNNDKPFMVSRIGSVELECLIEGIKKGKWSEETMMKMRRNAGFFPINNKSLEDFKNYFLDCLNEVDLLGVWYNEGEDLITRNYCSDAELCNLRDLEPYYHNDPWSGMLKGKKVLVIHPFDKSIKSQYENNRVNLFENKDTLPKFELKTLKSAQTISGNTDGYESWFEALEDMMEKVKKIDFDVAIIGAGAYGLPLAYHIKKMGKQAIHMGGATQILFGIKGSRWENHPYISNLFNDYWVRPQIEEQPKSFNEVEKGCYW